jgi:hypothetical protein
MVLHRPIESTAAGSTGQRQSYFSTSVRFQVRCTRSTSCYTSVMHGAAPTMPSAFANAVLLISLLIPPKLFAQDTSLTPPAQNSPPTATSVAHDTVPMPKDPAAILNVAAKVNGLGGSGLRPWHVRVSYQTFDTKGHSQDSGTYEEFRISDKKYKRSYTSSNFTQTDFATDRGLYRSGNQNWPGFFEMKVRTELIEPIPVAISLRDLELGNSRRSFGKVKLQCVTLKSETIFPTKTVTVSSRISRCSVSPLRRTVGMTPYTTML